MPTDRYDIYGAIAAKRAAPADLAKTWGQLFGGIKIHSMYCKINNNKIS